ncbi:MAG TPA: glycosyltransferase family 87 protein [Solirubrobacteraceae bacterium]|nr:glycosyltransferase family 87 protein [Solirubrobacteraceae bacterium]
MSAGAERAQLALAAVALAVLYAVATTVGPFSDITVNDLYVYGVYADMLHDGQLPYVDFGFEYPPLAAIPLWLAGVPGLGDATYAVSFAVLMGACLIAAQQLAARLAGTGRERVVAAWLFVALPVLIGASLRTHFDALPIAIALGGLLALSKDRNALGFALLGAGAMTKLFPGLLAVIALVWLAFGRGQWHAALRGGAIFTAVVAAISLPLSGAGYIDSFAFHLDRPVQIESGPASMLFALGGSDVTGTNLRPDRFKSNGLDGGHADAVERAFLFLLVLALWSIAWLAGRRPDARHMVLCGFAALLAFVTLGKVFSPQYVIWLAPFAALAWVWGRRAVALLTVAAIVLTHLEFPSRYFDLINVETDVVVIVAARNALLLAALVVLVAALARGDQGEQQARRYISRP